MPVVLIKSFEGLNRTKRLNKGEFTVSACLPAVTSGSSLALHSDLDSNFMPLTFLLFKPSDSAWNITISSPGSPACWLQIGELLSLHNHVSQIFIINLFIYILVLFLWRTLIYSGASVDYFWNTHCGRKQLPKNTSFHVLTNEQKMLSFACTYDGIRLQIFSKTTPVIFLPLHTACLLCLR